MIKPLFALVALLTVCAGTVSYFFYFDRSGSQANNSNTQNSSDSGSNAPLKPLDKRVESWWNNEYRFYQKILIQNSSSNSLQNNNTVTLTFNHSKLVQDSKSTPSGQDMRVVYLNRDNKFQQLNFEVVNPNTDKSDLRFALYEPIGTRESENYYYLYYGNVLRVEPFKLANTIKSLDLGDYKASFGDEVRHPLDIDISRKWVLRGGNTVAPSFKTSKVSLKQPANRLLSSANLTVFDKNTKIVQNIPMVKELDNSFSQDVNVNALDYGDYTVQVTAMIDGVLEYSPKQKIHISQPLYVNWSIDWEGDDVQEKWLQMLDALANENKVPVTHYFNPRIYVGGPSSDRAKYLTNWVLNRRAKHGDEIGLHLHMWYDMVKAAGLTEKREPNWAGGATGHDVASTAYTAEEFDQLITWSLKQFSDHGLPKPTVYRAGGWQINVDQLKILVKYGFKADSSGREYVKFGTKQYPVPWNLYPTTRPFKPSINNINATGKDLIGIWQFPNNGDNSSNYGPDSKKILDNFKLNYNGDALKDKQTFVILSHMQYFNNDEPVMKRVFAELNKSLASSDSGPIIYTTIEKVLPEYEK
jgi:peptidoglycan/xylan/chitin deacetylase (PgdA/CDA1 family)